TTGDNLGGSVVQDFVISQAAAEAVSCVADLSDASSGKSFKDVVLVALGNIISGTNLRIGGRIAGFGKIKRVFPPSALAFQTSVVPDAFKGGLNALAARDALATAGVIAEAGDDAPGISGETILAFGSTVANSQFPQPFGTPKPPLGVASSVQLSG